MPGLLDAVWADPSGQALTSLGAGLLGVRRGNEGAAIQNALRTFPLEQESQRRNQVTEAQMQEMRSQSAYRTEQINEWIRKSQEAAAQRKRLECR